jgi:hypothetical protein
MEGSSMNNYRVLIVSAVALLLPFCLVPSIKAQTTSSSMMHKSEMMTHNKSTGQNETTMSNPTADNGGRMGKTDSDTTEHMKSGHMMGSHMMEGGHGSMNDGGSTGQMSH